MGHSVYFITHYANLKLKLCLKFNFLDSAFTLFQTYSFIAIPVLSSSPYIPSLLPLSLYLLPSLLPPSLSSSHTFLPPFL